MALIELCLCGATDGTELERNGLRLLRCDCGVIRLVTDQTPAEYEAQYAGDYHSRADRHPDCIPYPLRYAHDKRVARLRWERYRAVLGDRMLYVTTVLDVGVGNGAFVDYLREFAISAWGIDPDPVVSRSWIKHGTTATLIDEAQRFDLLTYHDVLEHVLDPAAELRRARALTKRAIVVDVPDVSTEAGQHHFKAEHPWYFTPEMLELCLVAAGFEVLTFDRPVPGKLVAYGLVP